MDKSLGTQPIRSSCFCGRGVLIDMDVLLAAPERIRNRPQDCRITERHRQDEAAKSRRSGPAAQEPNQMDEIPHAEVVLGDVG